MLLPQKEYARLNGWTVAQVSRFRKEGYIVGWTKKPNGRIMIPADARTQFTHPDPNDSLLALREAFDWLRRGDYKHYVLTRRAMALALESAIGLDQ